eukprot:CAMPEP_0182427808 /NCGR_PEP_ID=MMETSP1167-20130531/19942_1 /TAXON_ID=2988 /ORGANISM="Mallomonas Sp, Strain CCMP3275" /LENGTH=267 /DNA_ID=CAMNT_0024610315 /DNA_START=46 /DNA_END=849 /DNA_ORIENTATION=-
MDSGAASFNLADELQKKGLAKLVLADEISVLKGVSIPFSVTFTIESIKADSSIGNQTLSVGLQPENADSVYPSETSFSGKVLGDEMMFHTTSNSLKVIVELSIDDLRLYNTIELVDITGSYNKSIELEMNKSDGEKSQTSLQFQITAVPSTLLADKEAALKAIEMEIEEVSGRMRETGRRESDKSAVKGKKTKGKTTKKSSDSGVYCQPATGGIQRPPPPPSALAVAWNTALEGVLTAAYLGFEFRGYGFFVAATAVIYLYGEQISV